MDFDEIEIQQPKFPKISKLNGKSMKISNEEEKGADRINGTAIATNGWISSRIVRVSRLTGGKDRHSKVLTSKGLRDRRVRLSVSTAIQFYDLQDRLGFDQPSKALEWLLKAAASSITELPPMSTLFPDGPNYDVKDDNNAPSNGGGKDVDSATSETSKNSSGLTLCRSDSLNRGRINDTKLGEIENENAAIVSQTSSFTELLSSRSSNHTNNTSNDRLVKNELNVFEKIPQRLHWPLSPMDYLTSSFLTSTPLGTPVASPMFSFDHHHLSLPPDNTNRHTLCSGNEYNLNFTMSSSANSLGLTTTGLNRGTLQSNSTSSQRLIPLSDGGSPPSFYVGAAENHHQFVSGFDGRFQLSYGDAGNNNGQKGKRKN